MACADLRCAQGPDDCRRPRASCDEHARVDGNTLLSSMLDGSALMMSCVLLILFMLLVISRTLLVMGQAVSLPLESLVLLVGVSSLALMLSENWRRRVRSDRIGRRWSSGVSTFSTVLINIVYGLSVMEKNSIAKDLKKKKLIQTFPCKTCNR